MLPLADVEAVTDPSCPDLTGRVLEMMAAVGYRADHPVARRAIEWLKRNQSPAGGWWGRWGINYIYGTSAALSGLRAIGADLNQPWIKRAVAWLKSKQNSDGGWGESPLVGQGSGLARPRRQHRVADRVGADRRCSPARTESASTVTRGVQWLAERQNDAGRVGRNRFHRHRLSEPFLSALLDVRALFSADGAGAFPQTARRR